MLEELMNARQSDLRVASTTIEQRMAWEQIFRIDRLERALRVARGRLSFQPSKTAQVH